MLPKKLRDCVPKQSRNQSNEPMLSCGQRLLHSVVNVIRGGQPGSVGQAPAAPVRTEIEITPQQELTLPAKAAEHPSDDLCVAARIERDKNTVIVIIPAPLVKVFHKYLRSIEISAKKPNMVFLFKLYTLPLIIY